MYVAPDAEAVRSTQKTAGQPFDAIWSAGVLWAMPAPSDDPGFESVVVQRDLSAPIPIDRLRELLAEVSGRFSLHRAHLQRSFASTDGRRTICLFRAPDVESVRLAHAKDGLPFTRAWTGTLHGPPT